MESASSNEGYQLNFNMFYCIKGNRKFKDKPMKNIHILNIKLLFDNVPPPNAPTWSRYSGKVPNKCLKEGEMRYKID